MIGERKIEGGKAIIMNYAKRLELLPKGSTMKGKGLDKYLRDKV